MTTIQPTERILLGLLHDSSYCPTRAGHAVDFSSVYRLALLNKAEFPLMHFIACTRCRPQLDTNMVLVLERLRLRLRALPLAFDQEKRRVDRMVEACGISAILFKHIKGKYRVGADLDILVREKDLSALAAEAARHGYRHTRKVRHKEMQLTNPKSGYKIDVHHLIAYPLYGGLSHEEMHTTRRLTSDVLMLFGSRSRGKLRELPIEWYVIVRVFHYWYNDLLCGLYPLYEIGSFCFEQRKRIRWQEVFRIAASYGVQHEVVYVLLLAHRLFGMELPSDVGSAVTFRIALASYVMTVRDVADFPPVALWNRARYRDVAREKYRKYFFVKLLVHRGVPWMRLIRFRILRLAMQTTSRYGWDIMRRSL